MPGKSISLSTKHRRFISREIKAGHYRSEDEVVRAGLDLLEMQKLKEDAREALRQEIQKGIDELDSGLGVTLKTRKERKAFLHDIAEQAGIPVKQLAKRA